jgi:hypothetical protein
VINFAQFTENAKKIQDQLNAEHHIAEVKIEVADYPVMVECIKTISESESESFNNDQLETKCKKRKLSSQHDEPEDSQMMDENDWEVTESEYCNAVSAKVCAAAR